MLAEQETQILEKPDGWERPCVLSVGGMQRLFHCEKQGRQ